MPQHLAEQIVPLKVLALAIAASPDTTSTAAVKMNDADGCCFLYTVEAGVITAVITLTVEESDDNSVWNDTELNLVITDVAGGDHDDLVAMVDVRRPVKDYVRLKIARTVADSAHGAVMACVYQHRAESAEGNSSVVGVGKAGSPLPV